MRTHPHELNRVSTLSTGSFKSPREMNCFPTLPFISRGGWTRGRGSKAFVQPSGAQKPPSRLLGPNSELKTRLLVGVVESDAGVAAPRGRVTHWSRVRRHDGSHEEVQSTRFRAGALVKGGKA